MDIDEEEEYFLDTVEGEISFFRAVMRTRPVGIHRHFHVLAIRNSIHHDTGSWVTADDIWKKLKDFYELEVLESLEIDGYDTPNSKGSSPSLIVRSPSPKENLSAHPYFREEYSLPQDETIDSIISARRMRQTASLPSSSPAPSPPLKTTRGAKKSGAGGNKSKGKGVAKRNDSNLAGLVAGDSDSSALTQESGDEEEVEGSAQGTRMGSVVTGTDAGTEEGGEEEPDDQSQSTEPVKIRRRGGKRGGGMGRGRRSSVSRPPLKKRKR